MKRQIVAAIFFLLDLLFLVLVFILTSSVLDYSAFQDFYSSIAFFTVIMLALVYEKIYYLRYDFWQETRVLLRSLILSFLIILAILTLSDVLLSYNVDFLFSFFITLALLFPFYKRVTKKVIFKVPFFQRRVKIVGNKEQSKLLAKEFESNWYFGFKVVQSSLDSIFIASKGVELKAINRYIKRFSHAVESIYIIPYIDTINFSQSQIFELFNIKTSIIKIENNLLKKESLLFKEIFEKILVVVFLPLFYLLHVVICYLITRDSSGGAIFKQDRLGRNRRVFKCYKYRTMFEDSDCILEDYLRDSPEEIESYKMYHKYKSDPRITKVGKILRKVSLDELPQLINVLKGEMSLVGPRPYITNEALKLGENLDIILRVKPGITGLWQVSGRSELSFEKRIELDVWYIQNWSLWMDIVILLKTLKVVVFRIGAK